MIANNEHLLVDCHFGLVQEQCGLDLVFINDFSDLNSMAVLKGVQGGHMNPSSSFYLC